MKSLAAIDTMIILLSLGIAGLLILAGLPLWWTLTLTAILQLSILYRLSKRSIIMPHLDPQHSEPSFSAVADTITEATSSMAIGAAEVSFFIDGLTQDVQQVGQVTAIPKQCC